MKRLAASALFIFICLTANALSAEELISPTKFTQLYSSKIKALKPGIAISKKADLELTISDDDGKEHHIFLDNAYLNYKNDPENLSQVIEKYELAGLSNLAGFDEVGESFSSIIPVIKHAGYVSEITQSLKQSGQDIAKFSLYHEALNKELIVLYAMDTEHNIRYLSESEVHDFKLAPGQLRQLAIDNLAAILPQLQTHGDQGLYMLIADGNYEASLLLADAIWTKENFAVDGDLVVAIPSRDVLLIAGSKSLAHLAKIAETAAKIHADAPYSITTQLFIRRDDQWQLFDPPAQVQDQQ